MKLLGVAMLPVVVSIIFYILKRRTVFYKLPGWSKQAIIGVSFGAAAICGTMLGVDVGGATANCRDAGPLCAGFFFGGPAGIIAGAIGGLHRWISAPETGMYTRAACSLSTVAAGLYAAALRKYIFEKRRPGWLMAALVGLVMEVFHMLMMLVTHMDDIQGVFAVIKIVALPMVFCNVIATGSTALLLELTSMKILHRHGANYKKRINDRIQVRMLIAVIAAFIISSLFLALVHTGMEMRNAENLIDTSVTDVVADIKDTLDKDILKTAHAAAKACEGTPDADLGKMASTYGITEINIVNSKGLVTRSNIPEYIGFDMKPGKQSSKYMVLTRGVKEMVTPFAAVSYAPEDSSRDRKYAGVALSDGGFIQIGYSKDDLDALIREDVANITGNRHIGNTGGIYIFDSDMNVVSATYQYGKAADKSALYVENVKAEKDDFYRADINGKDCLCRYGTSEGYITLAYYPIEEALSSRDLEIYVSSFLQILVFAAMFGWIFFLIRTIVVDDIYKVNASLAKITEGDLDERVNVHSAHEFDRLSDAINETVEKLEQYTQEVQDRISQELEIAKSIQQSSLPRNFDDFIPLDEFDIYATMQAARTVGGDFYDFKMMYDGRLEFGVADVSGKGIPGALFMMRSRATLRNCIDTGLRIDDTFTATNSLLCEGNEAEMFVTAWMGILDVRTGHVEFANAGHNPPLVYRKGEGYSYLRSKAGFVLAGMDGIQYRLQELDLKPGDSIFLYTDGITEAQNEAHELYGEERLLACLNAHMDADVTDTIRFVKEDMDRFVGDAEQFDDITMLAVRYNGPERTS